MQALASLFTARWPVIGVLHLPPLPGSARWNSDWPGIEHHLLREAEVLVDGGIHGLMLENFGDAPFARDRVEPVTTAALAVLARALRAKVGCPIGINVLRNDALSALSIAAVTGAQFIRVNVLVGAMWTDQGLIEGRAREVQALKRELGWSGQIWADVLVKHAVPPAPLDIAQVARDTAHRGLADVLVVSGSGTGQATPIERLQAVKAAVPGVPVMVGSGLSLENLAATRAVCDGCIVATSLQESGRYTRDRVTAFVQAVQ